MPHRSLSRLARLILLCGIMCCVGCETRTAVFVGDADVVRAGPDGLTGRVYVNTDAGWTLTDEPVTVPEGWYAVPPPAAEPEKRESF